MSFNVIPPFLRYLYATITADTGDVQTAVYSTATGWRVYEAQDTRQRKATGFLPSFPDNPRFPLVRITLLACPHITGNGGRRFASRPRVMIEGITDSEDLGEIEALMNAIDTLFGERASGVSGALTIFGSTCISHDIATQNAQETYKRLGGIYEFHCYKTP